MNKKLEAINLNIKTSNNEAEIQSIVQEQLNNIDTNSNLINIVKVEFNCGMDQANSCLRWLDEMLEKLGVTNCLLVPVGRHCAIKDISISYVKVVEDESNS